MELTKIGVCNLRSLRQKQVFEITPLVMAVGANSSGKSTFLRLFPLFRQSTETTTRGPILWYGNYVDFGIFDTVVSRNAADSEITFEFEIKLEKYDPKRFRYEAGANLRFLEDTTASISITVASKDSLTYTKRIGLRLFDLECEIFANSDGAVDRIELNKEKIDLGSSARAVIRSGNALFSLFLKFRHSIKLEGGGSAEVWVGSSNDGLASSRLLSRIKQLVSAAITPEDTRALTTRLGLGSPETFLEDLRGLLIETAMPSRQLNELKQSDELVEQLRGYALLNRLPLILEEINKHLTKTFASVRYMAPVRAVAQRFYRQQDLAINEVDPEGANLPMFLMGLPDEDRKAFSEWCVENLQFNVTVKSEGSHVSIFASDCHNGEMYNIADMGFGYSQLLPLLATVWVAFRDSTNASRLRSRKYRRADLAEGGITIVIEQPELHLHPRMQARFADLMVKISELSKEKNLLIKIICETHSEVIINRVGFRVADGTIDSASASVYLFDRSEDTGDTVVSKATFGPDGGLVNWPYGFFLPALD